MPQPKAKIGVIGGSGLYDIEGMADLEMVNVETPFGAPSDSIGIGSLSGVGIAFLPRHGKGHRISPTEVPSRANIYAFKSLGVEHIISINSCGSFMEEIRPGHLLIPDQIIDRTQKRANTFFGDGIVAHISFADPFCPVLSRILRSGAGDGRHRPPGRHLHRHGGPGLFHPRRVTPLPGLGSGYHRHDRPAGSPAGA